MLTANERNKILREVQNGDIMCLREILTKYPNIHWSEIYYKKTGDTVLHCAARAGLRNTLEYILSTSSEKAVDCKNNDDKTALHEAAQFSQFECCKLLLKYGADVNALKRADWTPLMLACTKITPSSFKTVELLLESGAEVNYRNKDGWTVLHLISREGDLEILNLLIKHDLDMKLKTKNGRNAMHIAALHGNLEIVGRLVELGLDIEEIDRCGNTALHEAVLGKNIDICKFLLLKDAKVDCENNNGFQLIHLAASEGDENIINFLLRELKLDVNVKSGKGWTPLHCATRKGRKDNFNLLLQFNADKSVEDNFGRLPEVYLS